VGDADVIVGADTTVAVRQGLDGSVTLELARGAVDCDVEPRADRPPFRVKAGAVTVTVIGTRFSVERSESGAVRVAVVRGRVKVASDGTEKQVEAGQEWRTGMLAAAQTHAQPDEPKRSSVGPAGAGFGAERKKPGTGTGAGTGVTPSVQPTAEMTAAELYAHAMAERRKGRFDAAMAATVDYERRFPKGPHLEEMLWLRVHASCATWRQHAAEEAAAHYLERFPKGKHAAAAAQGCLGVDR
jgi:hypothetical protein